MKLKITIILLLNLTTTVFSQEVTLESEEMTSEQKRVQKISDELVDLNDDYYKSEKIFQRVWDNVFPNDYSNQMSIAELEKKIQDNKDVQYEMQRQSLKSKCKQINTLGKSIEKKEDYCVGYLDRVTKILDDNIIRLKNRIVELKTEKKEKEDKDKLTLTVAKPNSDDFWNGKSENTKKKSSKNSDDDFWNGKTEKIADNDKEDDFWNGKEKPSTSNTVTKRKESKPNTKETLELFDNGEKSYEAIRFGLRFKESGEIFKPAIYHRSRFSEITVKGEKYFTFRIIPFSVFDICKRDKLNVYHLYDPSGKKLTDKPYHRIRGGDDGFGLTIAGPSYRTKREQYRKKDWEWIIIEYDEIRYIYDTNFKLIRTKDQPAATSYNRTYDYYIENLYQGKLDYDCEKNYIRKGQHNISSF